MEDVTYKRAMAILEEIRVKLEEAVKAVGKAKAKEAA